MRVQMKDGIVVCSLEGKNHDYLSECSNLWNGYYGEGYLKIHRFVCPRNHDQEIMAFYQTLDAILRISEIYGVEIDDEVYDLFADYRRAAEKISEKRSREDEDYSKREYWQRLQKNGCGSCRYLYRQDDDYICLYSGRLLEERELRGNGENFLKNVAFPTDDCPYQAEAIEDGDESYKEYKFRQMIAEF